MPIKALVLRTAGTNCDWETIHALKTTGAGPERLHLNELLQNPKRLFEYSMMVIPGGFSYGDDVAAGKILANELKFKLGEPLKEFVLKKRLVIGICNGFQVLVKLGLLPAENDLFTQTATLTQNDSGRFQCEWVWMKTEKSQAKWLNAMPSKFQMPIAHGEGKFMVQNAQVLKTIEKNRQIVFRYAPRNPNGSIHAIAGMTNPAGNVVGLMPHPERNMIPFQHPGWTRHQSPSKTAGLIFWQCAVNYAKGIVGHES